MAASGCPESLGYGSALIGFIRLKYGLIGVLLRLQVQLVELVLVVLVALCDLVFWIWVVAAAAAAGVVCSTAAIYDQVVELRRRRRKYAQSAY